MSTTPLIESQPPPPGIFPAPLLHTNTGYTPDTNPFYSTNSSLFPGLEVRPRLGSRYVGHQSYLTTCYDTADGVYHPAHHSSSSTPSTSGMAPGLRTAPLPTPYNARNIYTGTNVFPRLDHPHRSPPSLGTARQRLPLSPTPSPNLGFPNPITPLRMDAGQFNGKGQANIPPLHDTVSHGQLSYANGTKLAIEIHGTIDKGFFLSEGEWTCYRRNYFSCICSYSLKPNSYTAMPMQSYNGMSMQYTPNGTGTSYEVFGFAMTITAVVSESDSHSIELVQHTPKRDKGPVTRPDRVSLSPRQPPQTPHSLNTMYTDPHRLGGVASSGTMYGDYTQPQTGQHPTEHTFERIQFKQATANNGKRRAAQQYYHLLVELHAHVSELGGRVPDQWMKVAHRKSAKMIVRGRSPGHYQSERRGSTSSGPGGSSGTLGSYSGSTNVPDYTGGPPILGQSYGSSGYEVRSTNHYGSSRHHDITMEPVMSAEEVKAIDSTKEYQYYPAPIYEGSEHRQGIEMFAHRNDQDTIMTSMPGNADVPPSRLKNEQDGTLPSLFYHGTAYYPRSCNRFEGKSSSVGYYPTMLPQSS